MNLHIVPDSGFINSFHDNLAELELLENNKIVVRTNHAALKAIKRDVPFARFNSSQFNQLIGDTYQYDNVFIHYFTPLLYRWIATHQFKKLHWMVWGGDLYNLRALDKFCYEPLTLNKFIRKKFDVKHWLYELKVSVANGLYQKRAYGKVASVLSWMEEEYRFATRQLPLRATHKFFFYENNVPYAAIDGLIENASRYQRAMPTLIIGNSGSPANNHLDAITFLERNKIEANLLLPVSYGGDKRYIDFLKRSIQYSFGTVEFVERYMSFEEYLQFLGSADGLVMNTIRPQGYGNILMMMYMNKPVFFNPANISLPDLTNASIRWYPMEALENFKELPLSTGNKAVVKAFFSHTRLLEAYKTLFG